MIFTGANTVSRLFSCRISDVVATAPGLGARGGAIYLTSGQLHLTNTSLTNNLATSPPAEGQPAASGQGRGNSIYIAFGVVTYVLPAPPGRWLPAQSCEVCGQQQTRTAFSPPQFTPSSLSSRLTLPARVLNLCQIARPARETTPGTSLTRTALKPGTRAPRSPRRTHS